MLCQRRERSRDLCLECMEERFENRANEIEHKTGGPLHLLMDTLQRTRAPKGWRAVDFDEPIWPVMELMCYRFRCFVVLCAAAWKEALSKLHKLLKICNSLLPAASTFLLLVQRSTHVHRCVPNPGRCWLGCPQRKGENIVTSEFETMKRKVYLRCD